MKKMRRGFTLVELSLSMVFIGVLSVTIVLLIANTVAAYRRGRTLSRVNTVGMDIVDDMRWAVGNSSSRAVSTDCYRFYNTTDGPLEACLSDEANSFVTITKYADVTIKKEDGDKTLEQVPIYGAFCTGTYSYIWNSGYFEMEGATVDGSTEENPGWAKLWYRISDNKKVKIVGSFGKLKKNLDGSDSIPSTFGDSSRPFRLLKIRDDYRSVCASVSLPNPNAKDKRYIKADDINKEIGSGNVLKDNTFDITKYRVLDDAPEDLILADSENDLALFDLYVAKPAESTTQKNMFYSTSFILGTIGGGVDIKLNGSACAPPSNYKIENYDYCAINRFNFAMQASGEL